jgi:[ribosomal protein S5]-alanine N-acetyltransferase
MDIYLTALSAADAPIMVKWRNDPDVANMLVTMVRYVSLETELEWNAKARAEHEAGRTIRLGIRLKEDDRLVGMMSFSKIDHVNQLCHAGMMIGDASMRGKGIAKKAFGIALPYLFGELNMNTVRCHYLAHNEASQGLMRSLGFTREGVLRAALYKNGQFNDLVVYSLLRSEFLAAQGK